MMNIGDFNSGIDASASGFRNLTAVRWNFEAPGLYEESLKRGESMLVKGGALRVDTGIFTGRSPKDKFVVKDATTEGQVWWDNNSAMTPAQFDLLLLDFLKHAEGKELFAQDLYGGADPSYRV
ncbi:MAG: phosphoenolpyruvate carboxykinase (ATP), partial [Beijerinckiaceae bacterium]